MNTIRTAAASVIGARHTRAALNGQDATAIWTSRDSREGADRADVGGREVVGREVVGREGVVGREVSGRDAAVIVVCDGCSSGGASEVGARLGAHLFANAVGARLSLGESPCGAATWADARAEVVAVLWALADQMAGAREDVEAMFHVGRALSSAAMSNVGRALSAREAALGDSAAMSHVGRALSARQLAGVEEIVRDQFLFTIIAAAVSDDRAAVWALGDGVYSLGDSTRELGPFPDNAPPYLGYDMLGDPRPAHFEVVAPGMRSIVIATDGASDFLPTSAAGLLRFATARFLDHPDALRRELALLARPQERIDWDQRRVIRTPAVLQDDCAIAVLRWESLS